jgi:transposase
MQLGHRQVHRLATRPYPLALFDAMYSTVGRASIPPERLLKASLLMAFYTVRSERLFCEQLDYNILFRWFLDMNMEEPSFDHSTFSKNRQRLIAHEVAKEFFWSIVAQAKAAGLMSDEHFTVDGTLIEAWASMKSFRKKDEKPGEGPPPDDPGNPTVDFHKRSVRTRRTNRRPIPTRSWPAKERARRPSSPTRSTH